MVNAPVVLVAVGPAMLDGVDGMQVGAPVPHAPVVGVHAPAAWQESIGLHCTLEVGELQAPFWQVSPPVHAFPSLQALPLALIGFEHEPVAGLQVPATWHWSCAVQVTAGPAMQWPAPSQVSPAVQRLLSVQAVPCGWNPSQVHTSPSQKAALHPVHVFVPGQAARLSAGRKSASVAAMRARKARPNPFRSISPPGSADKRARTFPEGEAYRQ